MFENPLFTSLPLYAAAIPAVLLAGISKGGFGGGVVFLCVPLISLVLPPAQAAAIMLPVLFLMDVITAVIYRRSWHRRDALYLSAGSVVGVAVGWFGFAVLSEDQTRLIVGLIALGFTLDHWLKIGPRKTLPEPDALRGGFWGAVGGFTSFFAHAGSPPVSVYLLPRGLEKQMFVGTFVVFFLLVNALKLPAYWQLGQFTQENLILAAILAPAAPVGIWIGLWCQKRLSDRYFYGVCYVFLFATGLKLVWDGVSGYL